MNRSKDLGEERWYQLGEIAQYIPPCGSEPARDDGTSGTTLSECSIAIASRLAPTGFVHRRFIAKAQSPLDKGPTSCIYDQTCSSPGALPCHWFASTSKSSRTPATPNVLAN
ncbi:hypothetical protein DBR45_53195 [Pseudomonas sp. HMWF031]|nr:hypothetical protein DBR45_53195 [Pseudomonas sp. HMWF031]